MTIMTKAMIKSPIDLVLACRTACLPHSITSSALACSVKGTVNPSALAVLEVDDQLEFGRLLHRQRRPAFRP